MKRKSCLLIRCCLFLTILIASCDKVEYRDPLEDDGTPPGSVRELQVENLPGGARISYTLPGDKDLLYVKANYEIRPGTEYEVKASYYENEIQVMGFGSAKPYTVHLFAVDRGGQVSEKTSVEIHPLTPPVQSAFEQLEYESGFGGIHVLFQNAARAELSATVLIKSQQGVWEEYDKHYTALPDGNFSVRGLPAEPLTFGVYFSDRWENHSDTLIKEVTPLFEAPLDQTRFRELPLPGDVVNLWKLPMIWDDIPTNSGGFSNRDGFPKHFQIDMGTTAKLSRMKLWGVFDGREYSGGNVREFEVWGSNNPSGDGSDEGWVLMQSCEVIKPSGLPVGEVSPDDRAIALAGLDFDISPDAPAVRFLRIKILSTFVSPRGAASGDTWIRELKFWGQDQNPSTTP